MSARGRKSFGVVAALAVALGGCTSFDELDFTYRSVPPAGLTVDVSFDQIRIPEGVGVGVVARPLDDGIEMEVDTEVDLESKNPGVLVVGRSQANELEEEDEGKENWSFLLYGASAGSTEVAVRIDGELVARIPATVDAQP